MAEAGTPDIDERTEIGTRGRNDASPAHIFCIWAFSTVPAASRSFAMAADKRSPMAFSTVVGLGPSLRNISASDPPAESASAWTRGFCELSR
jgi:hypothetical protein